MMNIFLTIAAVLFTDGQTFTKAIDFPEMARDLNTNCPVYDFRNQDPQTKANCGWYMLIDDIPSSNGFEAVSTGYTGPSNYTYTATYELVPVAPAPVKYSKLKIYAAISQLDRINGTAWQKIEEWLKTKEVQGVNGYTAFILCQEISSDHPLFELWADEARVILGLSKEEFNYLLSQCVLDD